MYQIIMALFLLLCGVGLTTATAAEDQQIAELFKQQGVEGTLVISALAGGKTFIHNDTRAAQPYSPASTFKILNTLIAVEEKATSDEAVFKWDGQRRDYPLWNQDQTLQTAFQISCVWCYQQLARRIGAERYRHYLRQSHYGQLPQNFALTNFWLDGALKISAIDQVNFLKQLVSQQLPFSPASYATLRKIMVTEKTPTYTLSGKTGWTGKQPPAVGWYVGFVETAGDVWCFALNMTITDPAKLPLRQSLLMSALRLKGII